MPIHDWTRVSAGTCHDFHTCWIAHLKEALNDGLLPSDYYAQAEQVAGGIGPDVLTLATSNGHNATNGWSGPPVATAVAEAPPKVSLTVTLNAEAAVYAKKRRTLVIRHASGDQIVALVEIVSPGNKNKVSAWEAFLDKAINALGQGYHLLIVDLFPPGQFDPDGVHGALAAEIGETEYHPPADKPLTLASYVADAMPTAYVEPTAVGAEIANMPLFLDVNWYVNLPLETTYATAYRGVPQRWRRVLEGEPA